MRRPTDPEWLVRSLRRCYEMRDAVDAVHAENNAYGSVTLQDRVAAASIRQSIDGWIAYYNKELSLLSRRSKAGLPRHVARELAALVTERSGGAGDACSRSAGQVQTR